MPSSIQIKDLQLFRQNDLLLSINEEIIGGEILTIMGPSGSGKSSFLNGLTGTLSNSFTITGEVWLNGKNITDAPTHLRRIGILYQDPLLFSHLTVAGNIAFAMPKGKKEQRQEKIAYALEQVGLKDMGKRHPDSLSGGQQARIALLRVLLSEPSAILLDEPFSKLDTHLRIDTRQLVFDQIRNLKLPAIMVTHDHSDTEAANGKVIILTNEQGHTHDR